MSQNTTSSVRDLLPDNCFLNLEDEDNATLDLVTDVNNYFYSNTNEQPVIDDLDSENAGDSDSDSGSTVSDTRDGVVFERSEDIALTDSLSEFFRTGCGCHLVKGNDLLFNVIISFFLETATKSTDFIMISMLQHFIYSVQAI